MLCIGGPKHGEDVDCRRVVFRHPKVEEMPPMRDIGHPWDKMPADSHEYRAQEVELGTGDKEAVYVYQGVI